MNIMDFCKTVQCQNGKSRRMISRCCYVYRTHIHFYFEDAPARFAVAAAGIVKGSAEPNRTSRQSNPRSKWRDRQAEVVDLNTQLESAVVRVMGTARIWAWK